MSFIISKLAWIVLMPSSLLSCLLLLGVLLRSWWLVRSVVAVLVLLVALPVGSWLHLPLENRFPRPATLPERVDGIIVLGGAQEQEISSGRGVLALDHHGERLIEGVALAERYPEARLVFTGRSGAIGGGGASEQVVNALFVDLVGFDEGRVIYEGRSRNTWENALLTREIVEPGPDEVWLLVTSAAHMPRSMGIFRRIGWEPLPWPVDYQTAGGLAWPRHYSPVARLDEFDVAVKEWLGLLAYWLMDRTSALFPEARPESRSGTPPAAADDRVVKPASQANLNSTISQGDTR